MAGKTANKIVVCDASPLIFLAKLDQLKLLEEVTGGNCVVLECVVREVLGERAEPLEKRRLEQWVSRVRRINYECSLFATDALSKSDQSSLAWAVENKADWLVADDRLLRHFAKEWTIPVIGFCGILVKAVYTGKMRKNKARELIDAAIQDHGLRISIRLYQKILRELS